MKLSKVNKINPDKRTFTPSDKLLLNRRDVGIEIECEGYERGVEAPQHWTLVEDGSLRQGGIELVSSILRGEDILNALDTAVAFCSKNKLKFSDRCSVHVHLDVRHLDTDELLLLVAMYTIFEKFFFMKCGDSDREFNNHCRPIQASTQLYTSVRELFSSNPSAVAGALDQWPKYSAFNLKPVLTQGSIEFRHHVGTADKSTILRWINLIFSLASYARKNKATDLQSEIDKVCSDGRGLFRAVFPKYSDEFSSEIQQNMLEGARYIQVPINTRAEEMTVQEVGEGMENFMEALQDRRDALSATVQVDMASGLLEEATRPDRPRRASRTPAGLGLTRGHRTS